ncbi:hypothetical protein [Methylobacterium sp. BTF04]|uniref:hypothetical protein n=1 Tax=Methylobacterium sp. BTF04 TaxID=2708300 RepID=UPI001FEF9983|nr:hypothetical protein [Methylobacterium sp. BTF04]
MRHTAGLAAGLLVATSAGSAEAGCLRQVINRTDHVVVASQDGGPGFTVRPHHAHPIRYLRSGQVDIAVYCRAPLDESGLAQQQPAFRASYATVAVLDRCYVDIDGGGTQPVALNNPRQGDIVVAPYELACPPLR